MTFLSSCTLPLTAPGGCGKLRYGSAKQLVLKTAELVLQTWLSWQKAGVSHKNLCFHSNQWRTIPVDLTQPTMKALRQTRLPSSPSIRQDKPMEWLILTVWSSGKTSTNAALSLFDKQIFDVEMMYQFWQKRTNEWLEIQASNFLFNKDTKEHIIKEHTFDKIYTYISKYKAPVKRWLEHRCSWLVYSCPPVSHICVSELGQHLFG